MNDLISVIIPIYNVEPYMQKCVDSVLSQTYKNIEIILVDDGSTDSCGEICDLYADKDKRITVIHKENGGLSDARNAGIERIKGKYVTFIDSDDWVEPNYVECLYRLISENNADVSVCDFYYIDKDKRVYNSPAKDGNVFIWNRETALKMLLTSNKMVTSAWGKLYKSKYFKEGGIRYPKGKLYEDIPVTYEILLEANKIIFGNYVLYYYFIRPQSISNMAFSSKTMHAVEHLESVIPKILQQFPKLKQECDIALFCMNFSILLELDGRKENAEYENKIKYAVKKYRRTVVMSKYSTMKWRIKALTSYLGLPLSKAIFSEKTAKSKKKK